MILYEWSSLNCSNMVVSGDEKKIVALLDKLAESIPGLLKSFKILSLKYLEPYFVNV